MDSDKRTYTILHTEWSDGWGGQEVRILTEMVGMKERGHRVILATRPSCQIAAKAFAAGIEVRHIPFTGKFHLPSITRLARILREEKVDVCNTHSGIDSWVGALAAKLAGTALVRTRHLNIPLNRSWHNFVHYLADRVVTCGQTMLNRLRDECGFPSSQLASIPTGINFNHFQAQNDRESTRMALGIQPNQYMVLMVAVIRRVKRHEIALKGFADFSHHHPEAILVLAGDGPIRDAMVDLAAQLGITQKVLFLGQRSDVPDLMLAADVQILTSESEGVPQAVTQGLGMGLPVIATCVGGVPELVLHEQTGLLIPPEDHQALSGALSRLAENSDFAKQLGKEGAGHARTHFSLEAMLDATENLYQQVLKERA